MTRLRCGRDLLAGDLTFPGAGRITILAPEPHLRRQAGPSNDSTVTISERGEPETEEALRAMQVQQLLQGVDFDLKFGATLDVPRILAFQAIDLVAELFNLELQKLESGRDTGAFSLPCGTLRHGVRASMSTRQSTSSQLAAGQPPRDARRTRNSTAAPGDCGPARATDCPLSQSTPSSERLGGTRLMRTLIDDHTATLTGRQHGERRRD